MSTPLLQEFDPSIIPWQHDAVSYFHNFDYSKGVLEVLFSGSIGSAKSICAAHIAVVHCLKNKGARVLVVRRALKDLKRTMWSTILNHIGDIPHMVFEYNKSEMRIRFKNGSEIIGDSYDKGDHEKFRSLELTGAVFEEASESDKEVYDAIKMRVGRVPSVKENFILTLTNPGEPDHYLYKEIIMKEGGNKKVFYSLTEQNPFLPKWYIENLKEDLDPMMAKRMLQGQWISILGEGPYYAYDTARQFLKDKSYKIDPRYPLDMMHDFNIALNKPMSAAIGQVINGVFHIAKDFVVEGFDTEEIVDEILDTGVLEAVNSVRVFGDGAGKARDTRSKRSDYDIILKKLQNYRKKNGQALKVSMQVPKANPPIRDRQNIVNSHCINEHGQIRLFVYKDAPTVDEGLRLTKVKKGSNYQEDDSDPFQHVVTAVGYYIHYYKNHTEKIGQLRPYMGKR